MSEATETMLAGSPEAELLQGLANGVRVFPSEDLAGAATWALAIIRTYADLIASAGENLHEWETLFTEAIVQRDEARSALASSGNYVADDAVYPTKLTFANGTVVSILQREGQRSYLGVMRQGAA